MRIRGMVVAVMALTALAAIPASAAAFGGFAAESYPASLTAAPQGTIAFQFPTGPTNFCESGPSSGTLSKSSDFTTSTVPNMECNFGTVETNGCQLSFHPGSKTVSIGPAGCGPIAITFASCFGTEIHVPAQGGIAATYENTGSGTEAAVRVRINDNDLEYTIARSGSCMSKETFHNLAVEGGFKITAKNSGNKAIGLAQGSGGSGSIGIALQGGTEAEGYEKRLEAKEYPAQVKGVPTKAGSMVLWKAGEMTVGCHQFSGRELSGPAYYEFELGTGFSECAFVSEGVEMLEAPVSMNSCRFAYTSLERIGAGEYRAATKISCKEGDQIEAGNPVLCKVDIPAQSLSAPAEFKDTQVVPGNPLLSNWVEVASQTSGSSLKYTVSGSFCFPLGLEAGTYANGSVSLGTQLYGV